MENIKLLIVYYSSTGANYQLAQWASAGAEQAGAQVKVVKVKELAPEAAIRANKSWQKNVDQTATIPEASLSDLEWADAVVFSAPTRYGNLPSQLKQFLDSTGPLWQKGKLVNKVVSGMTSAMNDHGGQESTLLALYTTMYHWGALVVAPGYTNEILFKAGGNPYGVSVSVDEQGTIKGDHEIIKAAVHHQVGRVVSVASIVQQGSAIKTAVV